MTRHTFWMVLAFAVGAVFLLPAVLVGILAIVNGFATGNGQLVRAGAGMAGIALALGGLLWWRVRRSRAKQPPGAN